MSIVFSGFEQKLLLNEHPFYPHIHPSSESIPEHCNAACIRLNASSSSLLDWEQEIEKAHELIADGLWILWEMDFALYAEAFSDEARFLILETAVQHFTKTVWPLFSHKTIGVVLHRGSLNFAENFPWVLEDREECRQEGSLPPFFCRELVLKQLKLLASCLPEEALCFLLLDTDSIEDPVSYFRLTNLAAFFPFHLILKGKWPQRFPYALPSFGWDHGHSPLGVLTDQPRTIFSEINIPLALCLPEATEWEEVHSVIERLDTPFRVIPEQILTNEWDGVDQLIVFSKGVTERGRRKLLGFCAAGGTVLTVGELLGLPNEVSFLNKL